MTSFENHLQKLSQGSVLTQEDMMDAMRFIMDGRASEPQLKQFLTDLANRGETPGEIAGAAKVLREKAAAISAPDGAIDCCGTGGDASGTYNISTAVALVVAACGVPVAKHGNRASSSKSGTADVLEALGVNLDLPPKKLEEALQRFNYCFLMAPHHHQAMVHVTDIRKKLGFRTIFNLLGPLANPAGTRVQLLGVFDQKWVRPMAEVLKNLGSKSAWVVHGADGLDEITTTAETYVAILDNGEIIEKTLTPEDFGLPRANPDELKGGDADLNAKALSALLNGKKSAYRDIVLANAAAALVSHGTAKDLKHGVELAAKAIDNGKAKDLLQDYIAFSNEAAS